jgi:SNF2 family DNA or RNA helicase
VRARIALRPSGKAVKREDMLLWGLVTIGCEGKIVGDDFHLAINKQEAMDYIVNNMKDAPEIIGIPQLLPTAFITELYTDDEIFPHQKSGIHFLYSRERALLADDMGLGKTAQSILAANQVKAEGLADTLVVVCPVTLQANWRRELLKWESSFSDVRIIPYSQLHKIDPVDMPERCVVIFDESHYLKNATSRRTQCAIELVDACKDKIVRLWLLTGTPVTKDNSDLWASAMMLNHPLRKMSPLRLAGMKGDNNAVLSGAFKTHMLMRKKEDCLNLPPKIRQTVDVNTNMAKHVDVSILKKGNVDAIMEHLMKLKRMSAEAKIEAAIEFIEPLIDAGNKVVLFSDHTNPLHRIAEHFGRRSVLLDGSTKPQDRDSFVQRFQSENDCLLFCGNIKAAGVGITLTASTTVVFVDLTWLPSDIAQAEDRCHRIGTTGTVNVYYLTDPDLITDCIILKILGNRSGEIASFEGAKATILAEVQSWVDRNAE